MRKNILYLDRDGIVNKHIPYVGNLDRFFWHNEIFEIANFFYKNNFDIKIVTNQSGIERGYFTFCDYAKICNHILKEFNSKEINLEIRTCPHHPDKNCVCRKPNTGMFLDKRNKKDIMIGDQDSDMLAAKNAGIRNRWLISKNITSYNATKIFNSHNQLLDYLFLNNSRKTKY